MIERRTFLGGAGGVVMLATTGAKARGPAALGGEALRAAIAACERDSGGRLGVAVLDTGTRQRFAWRGDERFAMCSTFKFLLAAAILRGVDRGGDTLERRVKVTAADMIQPATFTATRVGRDASVAELCEAAVGYSDNPAANLLLPAVGGPAGLTRFVRASGDAVTRLDRIEPGLGEAAPGDPRDTTSPGAMLGSLDRLLLGGVLHPASRARLTGWLVGNRTGGTRLRAGLPRDWRIGDKTGSGGHGTTNDIGIAWPPGRPPLLMTCYLTQSTLGDDGRAAIIARVARAIAAAYR